MREGKRMDSAINKESGDSKAALRKSMDALSTSKSSGTALQMTSSAGRRANVIAQRKPIQEGL